MRRLFALLVVAGILIQVVGRSLDPHLPSPGGPPQLFANQCREDLRRTLAAAMDRAERSIYLATYTLSDPKILAALKRAVTRGIEVKVFLDAKQAKTAIRELGSHALPIKRPKRGLMHQKLLVIDGEEVWLGTANMTYSSLRCFGNLVVWARSPPLAQRLQTAMGRDGSIADHQFSSASQELEYWQLPAGSSALDRLVQLLDEAKKTIRVAMFTWTHEQLTKAVIRAHKRGVAVAVVIDRPSGLGASRRTVEALKSNGIDVRLSIGPQLLHHKLAWVDETLVVGSANWTASAFKSNCDCFLILHPLSHAQERVMKRLWRIIRLESNSAE
jgi:cardiolipin synthase A/B